MLVALIKLIDVLGRAGFTLTAAFLLPLVDAGRFGIVTTLTGLFAFAIGWERHVDVQRRFVRAAEHSFDGAVLSAIRLYAANGAWMLPILAVLLVVWIGANPLLLGCCAVIVVSEQLSNQLYNLTLVQPRYCGALASSAAKNAALFVATAAIGLFQREEFTFSLVIYLWTGFSVAGSAVLAVIWSRIRVQPPEGEPARPLGLMDQYRASATHFLIGALAVVSLQIDRLVVGALLPLEQVGLYFRHVLLVSFAYQFFNVVFYNRLLPRVFSAAQSQSVSILQAMVRREFAVIAGCILAAAGGAVAFDALTRHVLSERLSLSVTLGLVLLAGAVIRIGADLQGLVLNARMRERRILRNQFAAFAIGSIALIALTIGFGTLGTAAATVFTAAIYLALNVRANVSDPDIGSGAGEPAVGGVPLEARSHEPESR